MASITNTLAAGLERVAPELANYYSFDNSLAAMLQPGKAERVSRYLYRTSYKKHQGGSSRKFSADGGTLGVGSSPSYGSFTAGFIYTTLNFKITQEQIDLSETSEQARVNTLTDILSNAMQTLSQHDNIYLFNNGKGTLTNASSAISGSTILTFDSATDGLKTNQLFIGQQVAVWDSTLATQRAGGPFHISGINHATKTVTLDAAVTSLTQGDILTVYGLEAYGPPTPTSFSSTWPGGGLTTAAGLTGDSFRHGLWYVNDDTTSNYYLAKLKSSFPEFLPQNQDAGNLPLSYSVVESLKNDIIQARGPEVVSQMYGVLHGKTLQHLQDAGVAITRDLASANPTLKDLMPEAKYGQVYNVSGVPHFVSRCQDRARIDYFIKGNWTRVEARPAGFHKAPDSGSKFFPVRSSDAVTAAWQMFLIQGMDWVCEDPGAGGFIDNIAIS